MRIEKGVMVMKDGKAWGVVSASGGATTYGKVIKYIEDLENNL